MVDLPQGQLLFHSKHDKLMRRETAGQSAEEPADLLLIVIIQGSGIIRRCGSMEILFHFRDIDARIMGYDDIDMVCKEDGVNKKKIYTRRKGVYYEGKVCGINAMSKYEPLWKYIQKNGIDSFMLTFAEIEKIAGLPIDHAFLTYKKELQEYGYKVGKISMKEQTVSFEKL